MTAPNKITKTVKGARRTPRSEIRSFLRTNLTRKGVEFFDEDFVEEYGEV